MSTRTCSRPRPRARTNAPAPAPALLPPCTRAHLSFGLPRVNSTHAPAVSASIAGRSAPQMPVKATPKWRPLSVKKMEPSGFQPQPTVSPTPNEGPYGRPPLEAPVVRNLLPWLPAPTAERGKASNLAPRPEW
eukprot:1738362-Pleurochrysis_carterae.AAC.1